MRLLCVLLVVGVAGGAAAEKELSALNNKTEGEVGTYPVKWDGCLRKEDEDLCLNGFFFTATALKGVRRDGEVAVVLSLEESLHPHVTFDLSLRSLGGNYTGRLHWRGEEEQWGEGEVHAREEVTLEVNTLRRVVLRGGDLPRKGVYLVVNAFLPGHAQFWRQTHPTPLKVTKDVEVFVQTEKLEYAIGDTVDYRVVVVDGNVDKTPKFAQVILTRIFIRLNETRLPWVEVPASGIVRGNFTVDGQTLVEVRVTSNVTSSDFAMATTAILERREDSREEMSVRLEGLRVVSFSQPRVKGRVTLTSTEGLPLEGTCNVTIEPDWWERRKFAKDKAEKRVAVGLEGGEFEFDVVEELGAMWEEADENEEVEVNAKCSHVEVGGVVEATEKIRLWRSLFKVNLLSVGSQPLHPTTNSSHTETTVFLSFLVERRDGGSVEEEEPKKGLHVELLLSKENLERLRPSVTNFSLPIPPNGVVNVQFHVKDAPPAFWRDRVRMSVGDAKEEALLDESGVDLLATIHVTPVDPARLVRRGDVVRFHLRTCLPYSQVNAILCSSKAIFSSQRFSFSPPGGWLDEVIELTIPQNVTEGSLNLMVYGRSTNPYQPIPRREGDAASVRINVVPSSGLQTIQIVDQVDVDMSTVVTFRLEGMSADSVVSLQAAKLDLLEGHEQEKEEYERPLMCHKELYRINGGNRKFEIRDDSPGAVGPRDVEIMANFPVLKTSPVLPPSLIFIDVDRKTSTKDNGILTVTKVFDRLTEFGTYVVSGATFNSKSGRTVFSNSPVLRILPPPVTLSLSVPTSVNVGEPFEVVGYVKNNLATPFEGPVMLESSGGGSTEVREELGAIKPNSIKVVKMQVTPVKVGDLVVSLKTNVSSRLTVTKKVQVNP